MDENVEATVVVVVETVSGVALGVSDFFLRPRDFRGGFGGGFGVSRRHCGKFEGLFKDRTFASFTLSDWKTDVRPIANVVRVLQKFR